MTGTRILPSCPGWVRPSPSRGPSRQTGTYLTGALAPSEPSNAGAATDPDWTTYEIPEAALAVMYPSSWARSTDPLMPNLVDPSELVALSTFPARPGGENRAHMPENAIEDMGPTDALVVIQERLGGPEDGTVAAGDYPRRPAQFGPGTGYPSEAVHCLDQRKAFSTAIYPSAIPADASTPMSRSEPRPHPRSVRRPGRSSTASKSSESSGHLSSPAPRAGDHRTTLLSQAAGMKGDRTPTPC
jgi:hypothetical protein